MIIECELLNLDRAFFLDSMWSHNTDDPLVVRVEFEDQPAVWHFSLDLLMEAFTSPEEGIQGYGDVRVDVGPDFSVFHLSNGQETASLRFSTADIREFLDQIGEVDPEGIISRELDRFLETL